MIQGHLSDSWQNLADHRRLFVTLWFWFSRILKAGVVLHSRKAHIKTLELQYAIKPLWK